MCGSAGALVAAAALVWASEAPIAGQTSPARQGSAKAAWSPPRTPWGDPDISGYFTNKDEQGVPFERPAEFAGRQQVTDEEFNARISRAQHQLETDNAEFDIGTADTSNAGQVGSGPRLRRTGSIVALRAAGPHESSILRMAASRHRRRKGRSASPIAPPNGPERAAATDRPIPTWTEVCTIAASRAACPDR